MTSPTPTVYKSNPGVIIQKYYIVFLYVEVLNITLKKLLAVFVYTKLGFLKYFFFKKHTLHKQH